MNYAWYFNDELSPSNVAVDNFADSKFGIEKWTSFSREIIQNSLDARDNYNEPVEIVFELNKKLTLSDIPGGEYTKYVLNRCAQKVTNKQTKQAYKKGLEILDKQYVYCLKISDFNTKGVKTGRDEAWGAFVFDEGVSVKQRPGSAAGSHGVGKKVPFIISTCNTVFYSTKNKYDVDGIQYSDMLMQGKTVLANWDDENGTAKAAKGWFGVINDNAILPKDKISPICNDNFDEINPFFVRKDEFGTDVIIIGVNAYDSEEEIKRRIISSILENFFVAIKEDYLKINVFGEIISNKNIDKIFRTQYKPTESLRNSLNDLFEIYNKEPEIIPIEKSGEKLGEVWIYFTDSSEMNRKYYTVVREHGMKIHEYRINRADKAFSAITVIKGEKLNSLLSELENAAHDDFVTYDEDMDLNADAIKALKITQKCIEEYIVENTKIDEGEDQPIDGLYDILAIPGFTPKITKKESKAVVRKNKVHKQKKKVSGEPKPKPEPKPEPRQKIPSPFPRKKKEKPERVYNTFSLGPILIKNNDGYLLRVKTKHDIKDGEFRIMSINSDDRVDNSISELIVAAYDKHKKYKVKEGNICKVRLDKDTLYEIQIKTSRDIRYRLISELWYKEV